MSIEFNNEPRRLSEPEIVGLGGGVFSFAWGSSSMRNSVRAVPVVLFALFSGCNSTPVGESVVEVGPHHGTMIRLSENQGFVELTNEPEVRDRRSGQPTSIVVYFLKPDGKAPLEPTPTGVAFVLSQVGAKAKSAETVPLAAEPKADDPAGAARFASKPGAYVLAGLRGKLNAKVGGQDIAVEVEGSR